MAKIKHALVASALIAASAYGFGVGKYDWQPMPLLRKAGVLTGQVQEEKRIEARVDARRSFLASLRRMQTF